MTTAREQAREAAFKCITPYAMETTEAAANAASDVWEPLLRELAEAVENDFSPHQSRGARTARALARSKEALNE